eukprot:tig00000140_g8474.t1
MAAWIDLPDAILGAIFAALGQGADAANLALCCKRNADVWRSAMWDEVSIDCSRGSSLRSYKRYLGTSSGGCPRSLHLAVPWLVANDFRWSELSRVGHAVCSAAQRAGSRGPEEIRVRLKHLNPFSAFLSRRVSALLALLASQGGLRRLVLRAPEGPGAEPALATVFASGLVDRAAPGSLAELEDLDTAGAFWFDADSAGIVGAAAPALVSLRASAGPWGGGAELPGRPGVRVYPDDLLGAFAGRELRALWTSPSSARDGRALEPGGLGAGLCADAGALGAIGRLEGLEELDVAVRPEDAAALAALAPRLPRLRSLALYDLGPAAAPAAAQPPGALLRALAALAGSGARPRGLESLRAAVPNASWDGAAAAELLRSRGAAALELRLEHRGEAVHRLVPELAGALAEAAAGPAPRLAAASLALLAASQDDARALESLAAALRELEAPRPPAPAARRPALDILVRAADPELAPSLCLIVWPNWVRIRLSSPEP